MGRSTVQFLIIEMKITKYLLLIVILFQPLSSVFSFTDITAEQWRTLSKSQNAALTEEQEDFASYVFSACHRYVRIESVKNFKKRMLDPMNSSPYKLDNFWLAPGCEAQYIGGTFTTLNHLAVENPTDRLPYVIALRKYYLVEQNRPDTWARIMRVQDTRGHTLLDYIEFLKTNKKYIDEEMRSVESMISFLCENGAEYSVYSKKCLK